MFNLLYGVLKQMNYFVCGAVTFNKSENIFSSDLGKSSFLNFTIE